MTSLGGDNTPKSAVTGKTEALIDDLRGSLTIVAMIP
jgi:hypothetical protein